MADQDIDSNEPEAALPHSIELDAFEARVLACLIEKEALIPDAYPITLNALHNACNQLTSRDPVMQISQDGVESALQGLVTHKLAAVVQQAGARVLKYEHRVRPHFSIRREHAIVLAVLMLRGAQTIGELRQRTERMLGAESVGNIEESIQFLLDKFPPLVVRLPKAPGSKESRFAHLLSGADAIARAETTVGLLGSGSNPEERTLATRVADLERANETLTEEIRHLREALNAFRAEFK